MARDRDRLADSFDTGNSDGWLSGFLAEEDGIDRRTLWRLGSWGVGSVGAVIVALLANQSSIKGRQDQFASVDLARQSQQIQWVAKESQGETRRLASAIDTLNGDRDRLYSRITTLEQGLDSVTGSIGRQLLAAGLPQALRKTATSELQSAAPDFGPSPVVAAPATAAATPAEKPGETAPDDPPAIAAVASVRPMATPAMPLMASKSMLAPPDPAAAKLSEPEPLSDPAAATEPTASITAAPRLDSAAQQASLGIPVQRTEFGIDLGGTNSIEGLRTLWRRLLKSNKSLAALRPIIVVKERNNGLGMQLRLVAGPLVDAAAAARICAGLTEGDHVCETSVFDGQRLALKDDDSPSSVSTRPSRKRSSAKRPKTEEPAPKPKTSSLSSLLGTR